MRTLGSSASNRLPYYVLASLGMIALASMKNNGSESTLSVISVTNDKGNTGRQMHVGDEGAQKSIAILTTASSSGRFVQSSPHNEHIATEDNGKELNWTDVHSTRYQAPKEWADKIGFSETLVDGFHLLAHHHHKSTNSSSHKPLPKRDQELLSGLRGKTLLMFGDSTTDNIYSAMCHCPRDHNVDPSLQGSLEHDSQTACFHDPGSGCVGPKIKTCHIQTLNLTLHSVQGEYLIHPYGNMPYERGQNPECTSNMDLSSCLRKKWDVSCNMADGLNCMSNSSCPNHRPPDMVLFNVNLWFWFRMNWYGRLDEKNYDAMSWGGIEDAYMTNMTTVLRTLAGDYLKGVKVVVLQTVPGTKVAARIPLDKVMHTNSAIRSLLSNLNAIGGNPPVGLLELDHMGHMGWDRGNFLLDDVHPQFVFNNAVANILFNALAVL